MLLLISGVCCGLREHHSVIESGDCPVAAHPTAHFSSRFILLVRACRSGCWRTGGPTGVGMDFCLQDQVLYLWRGGIGQCWQILPLRQVQKVQLVQSLFLRKHQLVQLRFDTANGSITLAAIPNQQARDLYAQVLSLRH